MPRPAPRSPATDSELLAGAHDQTRAKRTLTYLRLLGPGWLQSALKLGGGTLTTSLYLGTLSGFALLWVQPVTMFLGIIMLWGFGYVIMSTGMRPFRAITHVNPVLGWGWILAALFSSMIWDLPQYAMAYGVLSQNLLPGFLGDNTALGGFGSRVVVSGTILVLCTTITWTYDGRGVGVRMFDRLLQLMVWLIVACFIGVVVRLSYSADISWGAVAAGFIPDLRLLTSPAATYEPLLAALGADREYWEQLLVKNQRDVMIASVAAAAGVNGTFLFGYSVLRRRWGRDFLLFSRADLLIGMLLPFAIASSCVVVAGAQQFHTVYQASLFDAAAEGKPPTAKQVSEYEGLLRGRILHDAALLGVPADEEAIAAAAAALPQAEKRMAAALVTRDAFELAASIEPLTGVFFAHIVFGLGVIGMCLSSIVLHMVVCGMIFCEMTDRPHTGWTYRLGSLAAAVGVLGPFIWTKAAFWLAIPIAVFSYTLIPLTYITFLALMNSPNLLGDAMPRGARRWVWNVTMGSAVGAFTTTSVWMLWIRGGYWALIACVCFLGLAAGSHVQRRRQAKRALPEEALAGKSAT